MRIITLKARDKTFVKFKDRDVLVAVTEYVNPATGITYKSMKAALDLSDKVKGDSNRIVLEEADWKKLCDMIDIFPFGVIDKDLAELIDSVVETPFVKPEDVNPPPSTEQPKTE